MLEKCDVTSRLNVILVTKYLLKFSLRNATLPLYNLVITNNILIVNIGPNIQLVTSFNIFLRNKKLGTYQFKK